MKKLKNVRKLRIDTIRVNQKIRRNLITVTLNLNKIRKILLSSIQTKRKAMLNKKAIKKNKKMMIMRRKDKFKIRRQ